MALTMIEVLEHALSAVEDNDRYEGEERDSEADWIAKNDEVARILDETIHKMKKRAEKCVK